MLMTVDELANALSQAAPILVVDVRDMDEIVQTGVIPNARHIPLSELASACVNIPTGVMVVCVCASGVRAEVAVDRLHKQGYMHVWNVLGGIKKWISSGYECVRPFSNGM